MLFVSLAILSPLRKTFDYILPSPMQASPGARVRVPFGKSQTIGVVLAIHNQPNYQVDKLKSVDEVLDVTPIFTSDMLKLLQWASEYYYIPIGMLYKLALPKKARDGQALLVPFQSPSLAKPALAPYELNSEQQYAVNGLKACLDSFQVAVLDGITGSGKTEVYFKLIEECLQRQKQALILIPEINLGPQTIERFAKRFPGHNIGLLHSKVNETKRFEIWQQARLGISDIIIGTRLAAFTPLARLGLIIIDEEHDLSFKQQDSCRYSAKDLLIKRAQLANCMILLGSATLSLETWQNVQNKKYAHYTLRTRAGNAVLPQIEIIDTRHKKLFAGLSEQLIHTMNIALAQDKQVFIFLNRRGFAPILFCSICGWHLQCKKCSSNMIMHHKTKHMICHHCENKQNIPQVCPECQNNDLNPVGVGTERLELALAEKFPNQQILRVDRDTIRTPKHLDSALEKIVNNQVKIIIGTQMLAKGHHFPHLKLVAIVDIDGAMYSADFRAIERLGQLITQVAGRAGRALEPGLVLLQTTSPNHPLFTSLISQPYEEFLNSCLNERQSFLLPPTTYQILIISNSKKLTVSEDFLLAIKDYVQHSKYREHLLCMGPMPGILEKKNNIYNLHLTLQSNSRKVLHMMLDELLMQDYLFAAKNLKWTIDVDPMQLA